MRLPALAGISRIPLAPGTRDGRRRDTQVHALAAWTCRPCLVQDMKTNGDLTGSRTHAVTASLVRVTREPRPSEEPAPMPGAPANMTSPESHPL
jgi:hypothetical protein